VVLGICAVETRQALELLESHSSESAVSSFSQRVVLSGSGIDGGLLRRLLWDLTAVLKKNKLDP
jgi:hypothetical protein